MARGLGKLTFSKDWSKMNPPDFPTYEDNEATVRADIQLLYNEIRDYLNNVLHPAVNTIEASEITASNGGSVQSNLNNLEQEIENVELGQILDGSLTGDKFAAGGMLSDVTDQITFTSVDMDGYPIDLSDLEFKFSKALGVMFISGYATFTKTGTHGSGCVSRTMLSGPFRFSGTPILNSTEYVSFWPSGSEAGLDIDIRRTVPDSEWYDNQISVPVHGWVFCREVSS